jgi:hypothetical protein
MGSLAKFRQQVHEFWSVIRSIYPSMKSARHYSRALRLEAAGQYATAFELTGRALGALPERKGVAGLTEGMRLTLAVLHAQLAIRLGSPELAYPEMRKAIEVCGDRDMGPSAIRERVDWLRSQLEKQS